MSNGSLSSLIWSQFSDDRFNVNSGFSITGSAPVLVSSNGDYAFVTISGQPITLSNAAVTVESKGSAEHNISIGYYGTQSGVNGLTLNGTGNVTFDVSGMNSGDAAGIINVYADQSTVSAPQLNLIARGNAENGGTAQYWTTALSVGGSTKIKLDVGATGTGDAGEISFLPGTVNLNLGSNNGQVQLLANGGSTSGSGGTITSWNTGTMTLRTADAVEAKAVGTNGNGGSVTLQPTAGFTVNASLTGAAITVDGNGTGNGGSILIWGAWQNLDIGNSTGELSVSANATGQGDGGSIELDYFGTVQLNGIISATGGSDGLGGTITLNVLQFDGPDSTIDASGGNSDGAGGNIDVTAAWGMTLGNAGSSTQAHFLANGYGNGSGGTIHITSGSQIDPANTDLSAIGGTSGAGGLVIVNNSARFSVNDIIHIESGSAYTGDYNGVIELNSVECRLYKTGASGWPNQYWNCANPGSPTALDETPLIASNTYPSSAVKTILDAWHTELYVFASEQAGDTFFDDPSSTGTRGVTLFDSTWDHEYVRLAENQAYDGSGAAMSSGVLNENTLHELAHVVDFGVGVDSNMSGFDAYVQNDWAHLDYYYNGSSYVARPPCTVVATYSIVPPFQDVADVCNPVTGALNPSYSGMSNHQILQQVEPYFFTTKNLGSGLTQAWSELYPAAYAYDVYSSTDTGWFAVYADQIFSNGYFPCVQSYLNTVNSTGGAPTGGGACASGVAVPGWSAVH